MKGIYKNANLVSLGKFENFEQTRIAVEEAVKKLEENEYTLFYIEYKQGDDYLTWILGGGEFKGDIDYSPSLTLAEMIDIYNKVKGKTYYTEKEMEELIKSALKTYKQTHNEKIEVKEEKTVVEQTQNYKDTIEKLKYIIKNIIDTL